MKAVFDWRRIFDVGTNFTFSKFRQENSSQLLFQLIFNRKKKVKLQKNT